MGASAIWKGAAFSLVHQTAAADFGGDFLILRTFDGVFLGFKTSQLIEANL
jgi:hypothetical protein